MRDRAGGGAGLLIAAPDEGTRSPADLTGLLLRGTEGDREALDALLPAVYDELRRLADFHLRRERPDHTLQPTALVHEAYLRLVDQRSVDWRNRAQFLGIASEMMRRILVNHALARRAAKRGGDAPRVSLDDAVDFFDQRDVDLVALDDALKDLAEIDEQQSRIVELRFFGGLSVPEAAEVLDISPSTLKREWSMAKAWLHREIART